MADEIDVANSLIEGQLDLALKRMREAAMRHKNGSKTCVECGDSMPKARQQLGFILCVSCAQESERRKSLFIDA